MQRSAVRGTEFSRPHTNTRNPGTLRMDNASLFDMTGKVALVTGGSRGSAAR